MDKYQLLDIPLLMVEMVFNGNMKINWYNTFGYLKVTVFNGITNSKWYLMAFHGLNNTYYLITFGFLMVLLPIVDDILQIVNTNNLSTSGT